MQNIFISTLTEPVSGWVEAFPDVTLVSRVDALPKGENKAVFWLHMNEDRQEWMQNAVKRIQQSYPEAKIIVLANVPNEAEALYALSIGTVGYIHAYAPAKALKEVRTVALNGGIWLGNALLQKLIAVTTKLTNSAPDFVDGLLAQLTKREREVALEASKGLSNKEIARILEITERTVKAHLSHIFERLQVKDRLHLALILNKNYKI